MWIVTGASGFVGGSVLGELARVGEGEAAGLYRGPARSPSVGARWVPEWSAAALRGALTGATGVVHAASVVHRPGAPPDEYVRFNVEGTRALIEAARSVGVRRLIFLSSIKVHGEQVSGVIDEETPVAADAHYAQTKAAAERLVLEAKDLNPVVLRLCPVFGRGDKGNVRTVIRAVWRRRFVIPGDGSTRKSLVHVSTVAAVVRKAAELGAVGTFVVADRQAPSIRELSDVIASALGRRRPLAVPKLLVRGMAEAVGRAARAVGVSTSVSAALIDKSGMASVCDPSKVGRELAIDPHVDLRWAIEDEIAWLRGSGLL